MVNHSIKAGFDGHSASIEVKIPVLTFQDDNNYWIAHVPALDLSGYGLTEAEAKASLEIVIDEYFDYAVKKNTLHDDLKKHGWILVDKEAITPTLSQLLSHDPLKDIINKKPFKSDSQKVNIPAFC